MSLGDALALMAVLIGLFGIVMAIRASQSSAQTMQFNRVLTALRTQQAHLNHRVWESSSAKWKASRCPLLTRHVGWLPDEPFDLSEVSLKWDTGPTTDSWEATSPLESKFKRLPLTSAPSYSAALVEIAAMGHLFNGRIYRLLDVSSDLRTMTLSEGRYFDYLDTSEVLAFESCEHLLRRKGVLKGRYRQELADPFKLQNRVCSLGVNTLTLRVTDLEMSFFLHRRDAARVAVDAELISVAPSGEFTPSDRTAESLKADFDLWRNVMREYAEEFLGEEEARGQGGHWIDYGHDSPYVDLDAARRDRRLTAFVLGIGLDPLSWKPELLTACVVSGPTFDRVFAGMLERNDEGLILHGRQHVGLPFDETTVMRYIDSPEVAPSARSCLEIAWTNRDLLRKSIRPSGGLGTSS